MKEITYSDRAYFYYEETYSDIDHSFLRDIIQLYSINSVLDIPCGAGRNLNMLAQSCELAMFCDITSTRSCCAVIPVALIFIDPNTDIFYCLLSF